MTEPEVALAFTADLWVEELHRHLTDHGGARVRTLLVEPEGALEESYDVLVAGHRWPALTRALVADVHTHGRAVVGVHDAEEPASREHLIALGVDVLVDSAAGPDAFVRAIASVAGRRDDRSPAGLVRPDTRVGRLVTVGGAPGTGRTEIAIELALAIGRRSRVVLVDADDVAPAIAARLQMPIEPNVRTAIDAVEHGRGELDRCILTEPSSRLRILSGLPNASSWAQVRPNEVIRVVDRIGDDADVVVADGAGVLEDVAPTSARGRFATARAVVAHSDVLVAVCEPSPHGVGRLLGWAVEALALAPGAALIVVVNRAPDARFRRGEMFDEISANLPLVDVGFLPSDRRVGDAAWAGTTVARGPFTRAVADLADQVLARPRLSASGVAPLQAAS
jgi:MinD-like ATPase involved in chromosome partitioning or flagellar assembly